LQKIEKRTDDSEANIAQENDGKPQNDLIMIEAALYVAGHPLDINELCSVLKTRSKTRARRVVENLIQGYQNRSTAVEILELKDERFVMQLKNGFTPLVKKFVNRPLLSIGPLKTPTDNLSRRRGSLTYEVIIRMVISKCSKKWDSSPPRELDARLF